MRVIFSGLIRAITILKYCCETTTFIGVEIDTIFEDEGGITSCTSN